MKKISLIIISLILIFSLTACNSQTEKGDSDAPKAPQSDGIASDNKDNSSENPNGISSGKTLVVYFSATGNTKDVAQYIASATNGDLFELVPVKPYSAKDLGWSDKESRVVYEHNNPSARNVALVAETVENFAEYDTVFIGYPIWWGIAAWPVDTFIKANDFTGKTVIPFCTSASSGLGESGELLKKEAGTGNWLEGKRFSSGASKTEVAEWVGGLK
ncbi:MAG: flavodoxin [Oscillospiraceae bacterium]|nr:flavodoxin [Oscillospiraceae bacterium]